MGSWAIGLGFLLVLISVIKGLKSGEVAGNNPWQAKTLEWDTQSPPIHENFKEIPTVTGGPYEYR